MAIKANLSPRDQRALTVGLLVLGVLVLFGLPLVLSGLAAAKDSEVTELRSALAQVQAARAKVRDRRSREDAIGARYGKRAPALAGYLEQSARTQKLDVSDSVDRAEVPHGKRYVERNTLIHFKKAGMRPVSKFLEGLEQSGHPVSVSRLNVRKRSGEPDSFDVEVGVSAYDRAEVAAKKEPK
ncbi:MAG TPA: type II secretion system protein GspM [Polyangiaceae bacterium]|jgi:general secretion pathway protein M|nr:type II secretion system protein GspM [Polyangiaceae bacterium]